MTENTSKANAKKNNAGKAKDPLRATLNLPGNQFSMKANLLTMEPEFRARWERLDIHGQQLETKHENGPFVMHDGPPYANGKIHLGHLLNKVLKDVHPKLCNHGLRSGFKMLARMAGIDSQLSESLLMHKLQGLEATYGGDDFPD